MHRPVQGQMLWKDVLMSLQVFKMEIYPRSLNPGVKPLPGVLTSKQPSGSQDLLRKEAPPVLKFEDTSKVIQDFT